MLFQHESRLIKSISLVPVLIVGAVIALEYYTFLSEHLLVVQQQSLFLAFVEGLLFHLLCFLTAFSYYKVVFSDPGYVSKEWVEEAKQQHELSLENGERTRYLMCRKCKTPKPIRAHHCSICRKCVMKMDHHCPWVGNCIGYGNYKYFCLFILYGALACLLVSILLFPQVYRAFKENVQPFPMSIASCVAYLLAVTFSFSLSIFICFHYYLVLTGSTTIEINMYGRHNPFNRGYKENWRIVFGSSKYRWFLPISPRGNGKGDQWSQDNDENGLLNSNADNDVL